MTTNSVPLPVFVAVVIFVLGMASSLITAIIASLFLVEIANLMPMERSDKIKMVIIACFAIGLGAVLTPLGEPLSTIAVTKLQGDLGTVAVQAFMGAGSTGLGPMFGDSTSFSDDLVIIIKTFWVVLFHKGTRG